jgi:hypothetical protein
VRAEARCLSGALGRRERGIPSGLQGAGWGMLYCMVATCRGLHAGSNWRIRCRSTATEANPSRRHPLGLAQSAQMRGVGQRVMLANMCGLSASTSVTRSGDVNVVVFFCLRRPRLPSVHRQAGQSTIATSLATAAWSCLNVYEFYICNIRHGGEVNASVQLLSRSRIRLDSARTSKV